jgi:hypothetical protein
MGLRLKPKCTSGRIKIKGSGAIMSQGGYCKWILLPSNDIATKAMRPYSKHFIFFVAYKWAK